VQSTRRSAFDAPLPAGLIATGAGPLR